MSQLIALIIAIALGAIVTAIGYVFLGEAFTKNSEKGVALQFINQASQVEMAMTAFRAENARSAFNTDWAGTTDATAESGSLVDTGYLKSGVVAPQGSYVLAKSTSGKVILASSSVELSAAVCQQINRVAGFNNYTTSEDTSEVGTGDITADHATLPTGVISEDTAGADFAVTALNGRKFSCSQSSDYGTDNESHTFIYEVE